MSDDTISDISDNEDDRPEGAPEWCKVGVTVEDYMKLPKPGDESARGTVVGYGVGGGSLDGRVFVRMKGAPEGDHVALSVNAFTELMRPC